MSVSFLRCKWFQFTHPQGVRRIWTDSQFITTGFQFTPREGCDSPPSGRTKRSTSFNSRTREGCDQAGIRQL